MTPHLVTCAPDYLPHVGGAEVGLHTLLTSPAPAQRFRRTVIVPTDAADRPRHEVLDGVEIRRFRRPSRSVRWYAPTLTSLARLPMLVRHADPDLVNLSYALPTGLGGALGARLAGVPYICILGGNDVADPLYPPPAFLRRRAAAVARGAAHVLCFSTPVRDLLAGEWGVSPSRMTVAPFGVDVQRFRPVGAAERHELRARWGCRPDSMVVVAVQRIAARKGVDLLVDAVAEVVAAGVDVEVIVGGRGPTTADIESRIARAGLADRMRLVGFVDERDKPGLLAMADVFVLASRYEGQGISLAEASACGTAVVSTSTGGTVDMVQDGETGRLVPVDAGAFAQALIDAVSDPSRLRRWGDAGRRFVERSLSLDETGRRFADIVDEHRRR